MSEGAVMFLKVLSLKVLSYLAGAVLSCMVHCTCFKHLVHCLPPVNHWEFSDVNITINKM